MKAYPNEYLYYKSIKDYESSHKNKYSEINNIFEGRTLERIVCPETNGMRVRFEGFFFLGLSFPDKKEDDDEDDA
jgi:hypothetical protein